jgi:hypothetical protein
LNEQVFDLKIYTDFEGRVIKVDDGASNLTTFSSISSLLYRKKWYVLEWFDQISGSIKLSQSHPFKRPTFTVDFDLRVSVTFGYD